VLGLRSVEQDNAQEPWRLAPAISQGFKTEEIGTGSFGAIKLFLDFSRKISLKGLHEMA